MITKLLQITDAAIGASLPVTTRHVYATLQGGQPVVHTGGGNFTPVANDLTGHWSYQRLRGDIASVRTVLIGDPCDALQVTVPLRIVALIDRETCIDQSIALIAALKGSTREAETTIGAFSVEFDRIAWTFDQAAAQEFTPLPSIPTTRTLLVVDATVVVRGKVSCMVDCTPGDVTCAIIEAASIAKIRECLGDRLEQVCDSTPCDPCPIDIEVVNTDGDLVESANITDPCEQEGPVVLTAPDGVVTFGGLPLDTVPSGGTLDIDCDTESGALVVEGAGTEAANGVYYPSTMTLVANPPFERVPRAGAPYYVTADGSHLLYAPDTSVLPPGFPENFWDICPLSGPNIQPRLYRSDAPTMSPVGASFNVINGQAPAPTVRTAAIADLCAVPCPEPEPCDPLEIRIGRDTVAVIDVPCGEVVNFSLLDSEGGNVNFTQSGNDLIIDALPCPDPEPCDPFDVLVNGTEIDSIPDPCGQGVDIAVVCAETGDPVGEWNENAGQWEVPCPDPCPDLCDLLGEVDPEDVEEQVYDCLTEAAQDALRGDVCEAVDVEVNGTLYDTVASGGSVDIPVVNSAATPVGTVTPGVDVEVGDAAYTLKDTAGNTLGSGSIPAEDSDEVVAPDATVQLKDTAAGNIGSPVAYLSGSSNNLTAPDATVQLRDSAANNIGSPVAYLSNSSNNLTAPDGSVQLENSAGTPVGSPVAVRSNQTLVPVVAPDATIQRKDSAGNVIGSPLAALSNITTDVTCPDGTVQLRDTASGAIGSPVAVRSNQTGLTVTAPDATVQLRDSAANNIGSPVSYLSNSSNNLTAPDGSVQLKDSAGTNIGSPVAVRSNQTGVTVTAPDANVEVNGTAFDTVLSNGTIDVPVVNTAAVAVGTVTAGVDVEIADSIIEVNGTPETTVPAEDTLDVQIVDDTNTPVTPVAVTTPSAGVLKIEVPAGAPPAAPTTGTFLTGGRMGNTPGDFITQPEVDAFLMSDQWTKIAVGGQHIVAIKNGELWVYGSNSSNAIGQSGGVFFPLTRIGSDSDWTDCAAGLQNSYAIRAGRLYVVGINTSGMLGNGTTAAVSTWTQIGSDTNWSRVVASRNQSFAVAIKANHIYTCGANTNFQTGLSTSSGNTTSWTLADNSQTFTDISAGNGFAAAIGAGRLFTWGSNSNGRTAQGTTGGQTQVPTQVGADTDWSKAACGNNHILAIKTTGTMWGSGAGTNGRLGTGNQTQQTSMTASGADTDWAEVSLYDGIIGTATTSSYARKTTGTIWGCGENTFGQIGQSTIAGNNLNWLQMGTASNHSHIVASRGFCLTVRT